MLDQTGKWLPVTNTLAYLALSSVMKEKGFITLTPGVNHINLFSSSLMTRPSKLEHLPTVNLQPWFNICLQDQEPAQEGSTWKANIRRGWEWLKGTNALNFLALLSVTKKRMFYYIEKRTFPTTRCQCYKLFKSSLMSPHITLVACLLLAFSN